LALRKIALLWVTSGGAGYLPYAPGTWGSLVGILLAILARDPRTVLYLALVTSVIGLILCGQAREHFGVKDPQAFVLDETAGQLAALCFLPLSAAVMASAFVLFRLLDILKPLGIRRLDRMNHPSGIMLDDLAAGLAVNAALQVLVRIFPSVFIG
jgi:phosphatidylglycerophosphatase A